MQIIKFTPVLNSCGNKTKNDFVKTNHVSVNFAAASTQITTKSKFFEPLRKLFAPVSDAIDKVKTKMAFKITRILETKQVQNIVEKSKTPLLAAHLTAFTSLVLSGFYIKKTLENEKLDPEKRKTLAINQGSVCILSTALSYTINKVLDKKVNEFTDKFLKANAHESLDSLAHYKDGIKTAASIMIFMTIYRFIAPVIVTPIANHIGNKLKDTNTNTNTNTNINS